ncbi:MAG TPA: toll/interleukin-1 receptor domain-containing protein, partial [Ktedonobacteraceae bacterium]|nr:toll/interleukin-1 receptor domain-containing protein [Ktedonobacteraceae bacterium]
MLSAAQRIFVSHSHLDNEFVMKLAQDLLHTLTEDDAVFYDVIGLHGGDSWWDKIVEELTTRDVFLLILSPDAMNAEWVRREKNIALNRKKRILPVLYRECTVWPDIETYQIISFLPPKSYETAFQEILVALHLPLDTRIAPKKPKSQNNDPAGKLIHHMEIAFTEHDWPDVIRKAEYLVKHMPDSMTSLVYRWQAIALVEEGEELQAQEAFQTALALVSDRQERLTLLSDYTALLVRQHHWAQVLQRAREALRLAPNDPAWQAMQRQAQDQLTPQVPQFV